MLAGAGDDVAGDAGPVPPPPPHRHHHPAVVRAASADGAHPEAHVHLLTSAVVPPFALLLNITDKNVT